jgi:hypothetical protein
VVLMTLWHCINGLGLGVMIFGIGLEGLGRWCGIAALSRVKGSQVDSCAIRVSYIHIIVSHALFDMPAWVHMSM